MQHPFPLYPPTLLPQRNRYDPKYDIYCSEWGCYVGVGGLPAKSWEQAWPTYFFSNYIPPAPTGGRFCDLPPGPYEASPWLARYPQERGAFTYCGGGEMQ